MKKINIITNAVYASDGTDEITGVDELLTLEEGAVVLLNESGVTIADGTVASPPTLTSVVSLHVDLQPGVTFAPKKAKMVKQAYTAPTQKVVKLGYNGTSGNLFEDTTFLDLQSVGVFINAVPYEDGDREYNSIQVATSAGSTATELITALVAKINADPNRLCNAANISSGSNYGISLTGIARNFVVGCLGEIEKAPITVSTAFVSGIGTQAYVQQLFDDNSALRGDRDGLHPRRVYTPVVIPSGTYHIYTLSYMFTRIDGMQSFNPAMIQQHVFVVKFELTNVVEDMDAILKAINTVSQL